MTVEEGDDEEFKNIETIPIKQNVIHPCYNRNFFFEYDFMVSELEWSTELYKDYVVDLDKPGDGDGLDLDDGEAHELTAIGFGAVFSNGFEPDVLQEVTLDYDPSCGNIPPWEITDSMLCAGGAGKGACQVSFFCDFLVLHYHMLLIYSYGFYHRETLVVRSMILLPTN